MCTRPSKLRLTAAAVLCALLCSVSLGCDLPPATPTPLPPEPVLPTMSASPGTLEIVEAGLGRQHFFYEVCTRIVNGSGSTLSMERMEFTPVGWGGIHAGGATVGAYRIPPGREDSRCWTYQELDATHPMATEYRLRFSYYLSGSPTLLFLDAESILLTWSH